MGNCSEPSRFSCKSVNHACMNEHFYMEIYLADTPHRRNAQHFGGGSEQLQKMKRGLNMFIERGKLRELIKKRTDDGISVDAIAKELDISNEIVYTWLTVE